MKKSAKCIKRAEKIKHHSSRTFQIPSELKQRIEDYFQTSWSLNHGIDIYEVNTALIGILLST